MKNNRGITLIALVITIVVLIILAGVAINLSLGEDGIFNKAKQAKEEYVNAESHEEYSLNVLADQLWGEKKLVTGISLNKSETLVYTGETETLIATIEPTDATNKNLTWSSSDTSVATVDNGTITAVAPGTATITVKTKDGSNLNASCNVTVENEKIYLYNNGDQCTDITGGYTTGATSGATITYNTDNIQISSTDTTYAFAVTNNAIDLTNYSKLYVKFSTNTICYSVRVGTIKTDTNTRFDTSDKLGNELIEEFDISDINESRYLKIGKSNTEAGTVKYYQIWLEK